MPGTAGTAQPPRPGQAYPAHGRLRLSRRPLLASLGWAFFSFWFPHPLDTKTTCVYAAAASRPDQLRQAHRTAGELRGAVQRLEHDLVRMGQAVVHRASADDADWRKWLDADRAGRRVVLSQEMVPDDVPSNWRELGAAGAYDGYARQLAANLVAAGMGNAVIRLGHEMNGTWYHDSLGNDPGSVR